jgi:hypothetical protein
VIPYCRGETSRRTKTAPNEDCRGLPGAGRKDSSWKAKAAGKPPRFFRPSREGRESKRRQPGDVGSVPRLSSKRPGRGSCFPDVILALSCRALSSQENLLAEGISSHEPSPPGSTCARGDLKKILAKMSFFVFCGLYLIAAYIRKVGAVFADDRLLRRRTHELRVESGCVRL